MIPTPEPMDSSNALSGRLVRGVRPAVLVVDAIRGFTDPARPLGTEANATMGNIARLLGAARAAGRPVIFTAIAYHPDLSDARIWPQKVPGLRDLIAGSPAVEVDPRLARSDSEPVVTKKGASAVFGTELVTLLKERRCDMVVLCGLTTSGCVRATAVDLLQSGFATIVPRGCVDDRDRAAHDASLRDLDAKYADVVELDDALELVTMTAMTAAINGER